MRQFGIVETVIIINGAFRIRTFTNLPNNNINYNHHQIVPCKYFEDQEVPMNEIGDATRDDNTILTPAKYSTDRASFLTYQEDPLDEREQHGHESMSLFCINVITTTIIKANVFSTWIE